MDNNNQTEKETAATAGITLPLVDGKRIVNYSTRLMTALKKVRKAYNFKELQKICGMEADAFDAYGTKYETTPGDFFYYRPGEGNVLTVGHLDSVQDKRWATELSVMGDTIVFSPVLDDRLGVYVICELLPKLGINLPILLTTNEEIGASTAGIFRMKNNHQFNWMVEFDRTGTDVVTYCYGGPGTQLDAMLDCYGFTGVNRGSFSDISYLEHLKCKGFNIGVGYRDYHAMNAHVYIEETLMAVARFMLIYEDYKDVVMPHSESAYPYKGRKSRLGGSIYGASYDYGYDDYQYYRAENYYYNCKDRISKKTIKAIKKRMEEFGWPTDLPKEFPWTHHMANGQSLGFAISNWVKDTTELEEPPVYKQWNELSEIAEAEWKENREKQKKKHNDEQNEAFQGSDVVGHDEDIDWDRWDDESERSQSTCRDSIYRDGDVDGYGRPLDDPYVRSIQMLINGDPSVVAREKLVANLGSNLKEIRARLETILSTWIPSWETHPPDDGDEMAQTYLDTCFAIYELGFFSVDEIREYVKALSEAEEGVAL